MTEGIGVSDSLFQRVAAGDPGAIQGVVDRYSGLIWSLARRFLSDADEAEDAVQEIFIDLWKSAERFDARVASEATFVAMIARRRLIDRRRRKSRAPDPQELPEALPSTDTSVEQQVELADEAAQAAAAMGELREEQKKVLVLSIYHGLTHEQIARATNLPLGTVKTHARRGLIRIRAVLEEWRRRAKGASV